MCVLNFLVTFPLITTNTALCYSLLQFQTIFVLGWPSVRPTAGRKLIQCTAQNEKRTRQDVINDPLDQTLRLSDQISPVENIILFCFPRFWKEHMDGQQWSLPAVIEGWPSGSKRFPPNFLSREAKKLDFVDELKNGWDVTFTNGNASSLLDYLLYFQFHSFPL